MRYSSTMRNNDAHDLSDFLRSSPRAATRHMIESRWSRSALRAAVRSGAVTRVLPEHYAATEHAEPTVTRAYAATAWVGHGSVVLGVAAASAWELCDSPSSITVTGPPRMSRAVPPWLNLRRTEEPPPSALWHGCPVSLPALSIVTAYGHVARDRAHGLVCSAVQRRLTTPAKITAVVSTL